MRKENHHHLTASAFFVLSTCERQSAWLDTWACSQPCNQVECVHLSRMTGVNFDIMNFFGDAVIHSEAVFESKNLPARNHRHGGGSTPHFNYKRGDNDDMVVDVTHKSSLAQHEMDTLSLADESSLTPQNPDRGIETQTTTVPISLSRLRLTPQNPDRGIETFSRTSI